MTLLWGCTLKYKLFRIRTPGLDLFPGLGLYQGLLCPGLRHAPGHYRGPGPGHKAEHISCVLRGPGLDPNLEYQQVLGDHDTRLASSRSSFARRPLAFSRAGS